MKHIDLEFVNIQSHEHTKFHLGPGLNFILADDNNVGKSTIFKVILFAMQMPKVSSDDANVLIRGGCTSAKAVFTVEQTIYTLWLFRDGPRQVRAFFETRDPDGATTRSTSAPQDLKDAFDIVISNDGKVINFNDADSIQLVVEDTPKNDEVLAKVLIDLRVENIKTNAGRLLQETATDLRIAKARADDAARVLSTMHYCHQVADFKQMYPMLEAACAILDATLEPCSKLEEQKPQIDMEQVECLDAVVSLLGPLSDLVEASTRVSPKCISTLKDVEAALTIVPVLEQVASCMRPKPVEDLSEKIADVEAALDVADALTKGLAAMSRVFNSRSRIQSLNKEMDSLKEKIARQAPRVECPIKGEVYYTYEECIPVDD